MIHALMMSAALAQPAGNELSPEAADLLERSAVIASIDPTLEGDRFADLMPLKAAIGDARVVWLGEQSHGEGAAFLAKGRLVKFLHQEMGFDVLVWEAGMAEGPTVDRAMQDPAVTGLEAAKLSVFPIWTDAAQVRPTLDYVKATQATDRPITTAGMDAQITSRPEQRVLEGLIAELFEPLGATPAGIDAFREPLTRFAASQSVDDGRAAVEALERSIGMLDAARPALEAHHEPWRIRFVEMSLGDAAAFTRSQVAFHESGGDMSKMDHAVLNVRDQRMGDNLVFLADEVYPDRKLIVWAATFHGIYDLRSITVPWRAGMYDTMFAAGKTAHERLGGELYHIAFIAESGAVGSVYTPQPRPIPPKPAGSFGALLSEIDQPFLFTDLRGLPEDHRLRSETTMAPLGNFPMSAVWPEQFDAVFSIETEFPASKTELHPFDYRLTVGGIR
ncbi:MAG: erythromycin esterase family protein [Planctomycetota bacterium]